MLNKEFLERLTTSVYASSLVFLTVGFFGPFQLYITNITEFSYLWSDIWFYVIGICLAGLIIFCIILMILKPPVHQKVAVFVFALGVLFWIQGNLLVWNYGVLDGKEISWFKYTRYGIIDSLVWVLLPAWLMLKSKTVYNFIKKVCIVLVLVQVVALFVTVLQSDGNFVPRDEMVPDSVKYDFSSKKNVIILVIDTFQTDIFQELVNEDSEYKEVFDGFTYFRNALGGFPTTYASIPLILTGRFYDNSKPIRQFIKESNMNLSLPAILKQNGYQIQVCTSKSVLVDGFEPLSETQNVTGSRFDNFNDVKQLYNVTLFRYLPHFLKRNFYRVMETSIVGDGNLAKDLEFAEKIVNQSSVRNDKEIFKYFHLWGTHPPFQLNENLDIEKQEYTRDGYKTQARASLKMAKRLISALKNLGIYDNSMIVIVGDHGLGTLGLNLQASGYQEDLSVMKLVPERIVAAGIPLVLVKPFNVRGQMKTSDAPVSLSDIPQTVAYEAGVTAGFPGRDMFSIQENENRERRFLSYQWEHKYWNKEYLPFMDEYLVSGFSWLERSWKPTYRRFTAQGIKDSSPPVYQYGSEIQFGLEGNAVVFQGEGWSSPEKGFTWTKGKRAFLHIPVEKPDHDLILLARLRPFLSGDLAEQQVIFYVNDKKLGKWIVDSDREYQITIPKILINSNFIDIRIELPDAASPKSFEISEDSRILGVALQSITVFPKTEKQK